MLFKQRQARGPLSEKRIAQRIAKMTKYFNKPETYPTASNPPTSFFQERVEVLSKSDLPAILAKHQAYEDNFVNTWASKGEKFVVEKNVWAVQKSFSFKSDKARALKDAQMKKRSDVRVAAMAALREQVGLTQ